MVELPPSEVGPVATVLLTDAVGEGPGVGDGDERGGRVLSAEGGSGGLSQEKGRGREDVLGMPRRRRRRRTRR